MPVVATQLLLKIQGTMSDTKTISFHVSGMHCASCASNIQRKLKKTAGVSEASVNYANEQATVTYAGNDTTKTAIATAVADIGYTAHIDASPDTDVAEQERAQELATLKIKVILSSICAAILMSSMVPGLSMFMLNPWLMLALATPVQFWAGWRFYQGAWSGLKNFSANMIFFHSSSCSS